MKRTTELPEKCCAKCRFLVEQPKNNAYGDVEYFCMKIGRYIFGRYKNLDKVLFYKGDGKTLDTKRKDKCTFEPAESEKRDEY